MYAPPGKEGREQEKAISPNHGARKIKCFSAPSIFPTAFDGVPYQILGDSVEGSRFLPVDYRLFRRGIAEKVNFGTFTKHYSGFWHFPRAPPLRSEFPKIQNGG